MAHYVNDILLSLIGVALGHDITALTVVCSVIIVLYLLLFVVMHHNSGLFDAHADYVIEIIVSLVSLVSFALNFAVDKKRELATTTGTSVCMPKCMCVHTCQQASVCICPYTHL